MHLHCYQVNDFPITIFKKKLSNCSIHFLLIKGERYFCTEKKYVPPFISKIVYAYKRRNIFVVLKKISSTFCKQKYVCLQKVSYVSINAYHLLLLKSYYCNHLLDKNVKFQVEMLVTNQKIDFVGRVTKVPTS